MSHEVKLKLFCKNPDIVKKSLDPDAANTDSIKTKIEVEDGAVKIKVKGKKLSHLKAIINSYLSIISTLDEVENIK